MEKDQIIKAIIESFDQTYAFVENLSDNEFVKHLPQKWHQGQQMSHLVKSGQPIYLSLNFPKWLLKMFFGKANRLSRNYDELVAKYQANLSKAKGQAPAFFRPKTAIDKAKVLKQFLSVKEKLIKNTAKWAETDLDQYILPHPLLGKITMREMLYFTIYHNYHHMALMKKNLA